ncbi:immunoglobulin-like domain-containing protein [Xylocopilactobacillus apicola]|uniref:Pesticidal crystal protein Cry22Aa Ig-like domain-containing protein n=1 Tax=Xylocopilactobacillus apicola TaxID=2932184 RepID=A0AAU9DU42_9LACO|nr:immunoglobulin-like domain-containing protein [Xylocopilactobacillus apicola]BDR59719.1 hypothetical protein XA3_21600 [Xylocopilactobacillus apicola]
MKKSSRITNTIKYFGISSATLLAAAPVVAPTVTNVLGWYGANSVFSTTSNDVKAGVEELGAFDRTGYSDYDKLFQNGVKMSLSGDRFAELPAMQTITSDVTLDDTVTPKTGIVGEKGVSYATLEGIQQLAKYTDGISEVPSEVFRTKDPAPGVDVDEAEANVHATSEDFMHYLFTNTDGTTRTAMEGLSNNITEPLTMRVPNGTSDTSFFDIGLRISAGVKYLSSYLDGGTVRGILGSSFFGNPNKATLQVYIDGKNGADTPDLTTLLQEGVITITLVARSGDYYGRTAQANIVLRNSNVLFKGVNAKEVPADTTADEFGSKDSGFSRGSSILSNAGDLGRALPTLSTGIEFDGASVGPSSTNNLSYIPYGAVPALQTGNYNPTVVPQKEFFSGYYSDGAGASHMGINPEPWTDKDTSSEKYIGGSAAAAELGLTEPEVDVKNENVGAYATGSIIVPKGTKYETIVNDLNQLKFNGTPNSEQYKQNVPVANPTAMTFDNVNARPNHVPGVTWDGLLEQKGILKNNFFDFNGGSGTPVKDLKNAVVGRSFSIDVPVYGDIKIPEKGMTNSVTDPDDDTKDIKLYSSPRDSKNYFIEGYGYSKERVTAKVNVIVYDNDAPKYTIGTKPSFLFFNKSNSSNAIYNTTYDDGATLNQTELPGTLKQSLNFSVNDGRFTTNGVFSAQKLASYVEEQFGKSVVNKEILISDEDKATSNKSVDLDNLPGDTDYPHADKYTVRSDIRGKNISVDASKVDLSKTGSGTLTITYTNSKNEHGIGTETSTITVPYQVGVSSDPVFFFVHGNTETIHAGDNFDAMVFKVTKDQDSMNELVNSGKVYDGAPYVNDPTRTGLNVTVTGSVDTNTPGNYILTYTATNVESGAIATFTRNVTVLANSDNDATNDYDVSDFKSVGYINYVPGYGVNVYNAPNGTFTGQRLQHGTSWKTFHQAVSNKDSKDVWYEVGKNQWVKAEYVSMTPVSHMTPLNAVGEINYVPGYSVKVWGNCDGAGWTGKYLQHGTQWKVFGEENGYYNLGGNQWVSKQYINVVK